MATGGINRVVQQLQEQAEDIVRKTAKDLAKIEKIVSAIIPENTLCDLRSITSIEDFKFRCKELYIDRSLVNEWCELISIMYIYQQAALEAQENHTKAIKDYVGGAFEKKIELEAFDTEQKALKAEMKELRAKLKAQQASSTKLSQ